ncbi:MAG: DUF2971 domain-containing protein [Bryobacteraceae bacterium]|jgi:hypothetical protein
MIRDELALLRRYGGDDGPEQAEATANDLLDPNVFQNEERIALREIRRLVQDPAELSMTNVCVACFSAARDSLSQWRAYAPHGGCCIAFSADHLAGLAASTGFQLAPCVYDRGTQLALLHELTRNVKDEFMRRRGAEQPRSAEEILPKYLTQCAPLLKDPSFEEETEWRLISQQPPLCTSSRFAFREGKSMLVPYYKFSLHRGDEPIRIEEVIVGPTPEPELAVASIRGFLYSQGIRGTAVKSSAVPYRTW